MSNVKLRLKRGRREIEVEGEVKVVNDLLEKWWTVAAPAHDPHEDEDDDEDDGDNDRGATAGKPVKKRARRSSASGNETSARPTHDVTKFANDVKQHKKFAVIKDKIIVANPGMLRRIEFVYWFTNGALTSGDVTRSLEALGIKTNTPSISKCLDANKDRFLFSGQRVKGAIVRYTMTEAARHDFEKWLNGNG